MRSFLGVVEKNNNLKGGDNNLLGSFMRVMDGRMGDGSYVH